MQLLKKNRIQAGLVLLEMVTFRPYFPMSADDSKRFKDVSVVQDFRINFLSRLSHDLGFPEDYAKKLDDTVESVTNAMTGKWFKLGIALLIGLGVGALTLGIAAPFIGGLVGGALGLGLHGAAATMAGLAAIGGGAVVAGGLGVAGGTTVLVCGGAILGLGTGAAGAYFVNTLTSEGTLLQAVKLEVALKEIILQGQYDTAKAQEILIQQRKAIDAMNKEIDRLRSERNADKKRLKDLEKAVEVLEKGLKRNQEIVRSAA